MAILYYCEIAVWGKIESCKAKTRSQNKRNVVCLNYSLFHENILNY